MNLAMADAKSELYYERFLQALDNDSIVLPTLPEVALTIRDIVENEDASLQQISEVLEQDASISARLLKVANSPLYRTRTPAENLQTAVSRLGLRLVRDVVTTLAMKQLFHTDSHIIEGYLRKLWSTSVEVAATCRALTAFVPELDKEQTMLAGLVHNIGALPIIAMMESDNELLNDPGLMTAVILKLQGKVGKEILSQWHFPADMVEVAENATHFQYHHNSGAKPVDLVQVSLVQGGHIESTFLPEDANTIKAFSNIGMDCEIVSVNIESRQDVIEETVSSLAC